MDNEIISHGYRHYDLKPYCSKGTRDTRQVYFAAQTVYLDGFFDYMKLGIYTGENEETGVYAQPLGRPENLVRLGF